MKNETRILSQNFPLVIHLFQVSQLCHVIFPHFSFSTGIFLFLHSWLSTNLTIFTSSLVFELQFEPNRQFVV